MIKEYKNIKDYYSWSDEFENESESAKCTNSPRVYDLRTPQKKSRMIELMSDTTSDDDEDLFADRSTDKSVDQKPTKPTVPFTLASIPSSKPMVSSKTIGSSIVDQILLEESCRANQPISGSVIQLQQKLECWKLTMKINYTLFFQAVKNSSSHRMSDIPKIRRKQDSLKQTLKKKEQG